MGSDIPVLAREYNIDAEKMFQELGPLVKETQICLLGVEGSDDPYLGVGQDGNKNSWERKRNHNYKGKDFRYPLFDLPYINGIISDLNMTYTRLMKLKPKSCYSYHRDKTKRIHLVVTTNPDCWMIIEKRICYLPINGSYYITDTTKMHTAVNASNEDRIHIVGQFNDTP